MLVFWLACGDIKSYEFIVNGVDVDTETQDQIDKVLEDEHWWKELQQVRGKVKAGDISAADVFSLADDVPWGSPALRGRHEGSVIRLDGLRRILQHRHKRPSFSNVSNAGVSLSMRTSRIDDDMLSRHASHPSDSEYSDSEETGFDEHDYQSDDDDEEQSGLDLSTMDEVDSPRKSKSKASSKKSSRASSHKSKTSKHKRDASGSLINSPKPTSEGPPFVDFEEDILDRPASGNHGSHGGPSRRDSFSGTSGTVSPRDKSRPPSPSFTSSPPPATGAIDEPELPGPSIAFADELHPRYKKASEPESNDQSKSIYARNADGTSGSPPKQAYGFPASGSIPLSFNTLPSRAQHLILNDLMTQNSDDTAVIFTTLPAPVEGTFKSETDSLSYVSDLEVLFGGLPPMLLVHSNSMTVTMNL